MSFWDRILNKMGFEVDDEFSAVSQVKKEKPPKPKRDYEPAPAKLVKEKPAKELTNKYSKKNNSYSSINAMLPQFETEETNESVFSYENEDAVNKNVIIYAPKNQLEVNNIVDFLRRREPIIVNFNNLDEEEGPNLVMFISGALYALRGSLHPISEGLYLLTPEGVNILVPKQKA